MRFLPNAGVSNGEPVPPEVDLSIVICTHNRSEVLDGTLDSLSKIEISAGTSVELIVVMNGCTDSTRDVVHNWVGRMPFSMRLVDEQRLGLSHARNRGLSEARGEKIAFLDDDVQVSPGWLIGLVKTFARFQVDILAGRTLLWWRDCPPPEWWSDHLTWVVSGFDRGRADHELDRPTGVGANFAITRSAYERVGHFDPGLGRSGNKLAGGEESDYLRRAERSGLKAAYSAGATVDHLVPAKRVSQDYILEVTRQYARAYYQINRRSGLRWMFAVMNQAVCALNHYLRWKLGAKNPARRMYHRQKTTLARSGLACLLGW